MHRKQFMGRTIKKLKNREIISSLCNIKCIAEELRYCTYKYQRFVCYIVIFTMIYALLLFTLLGAKVTDHQNIFLYANMITDQNESQLLHNSYWQTAHVAAL